MTASLRPAGLKARLNYWLDRAIDGCDFLLKGYWVWPWPVGRDLAVRLARRLGIGLWLLRDLPRQSAYRLRGPAWTIDFVGGEDGLKAARELFFEGAVTPEPLGRVAVWRLNTQAAQWRAAGTDLVICETARYLPWALRAPTRFQAALWVEQVLELPDRLEDLTAGSRYRGLINRAVKSGQTYVFSTAVADLDAFYQDLYLPFVRHRHGDLAMVTSYAHLRRWFQRGGVILIKQAGVVLAGMVVYMSGDTCVPVEGAVRLDDNASWQQGLNTFLWWCVMQWGQAQGARVLDMGASHGWRTDGPFTFKRRWGGRTVPRVRTSPLWTCLSDGLSPALRDHLNTHVGFVVEAAGGCHRLTLLPEAPTAEVAAAERETARHEGLSGVVLVAPDGAAQVWPVTTNA